MVWNCPVLNACPYEYDACHDPKRFCRIIEDTPEHFEAKRTLEAKQSGGKQSE